MLGTVTEVELALKNRDLKHARIVRIAGSADDQKPSRRSCLGSAEADSWSYFIVREQMRPQEGFEILYRSVMDVSSASS